MRWSEQAQSAAAVEAALPQDSSAGTLTAGEDCLQDSCRSEADACRIPSVVLVPSWTMLMLEPLRL
jgi:hypothetical protein